MNFSVIESYNWAFVIEHAEILLYVMSRRRRNYRFVKFQIFADIEMITIQHLFKSERHW